MGATNALDVKAFMRDLIDGLTIPDLKVSWGVVADPPRRWVVFGPTTYSQTTWVTNRSREETFAVSFAVYVTILAGGAPEDAERAAMDLYAQIETAWRSDPSLGGLCVDTTLAPKSSNGWPIDSGAQGEVVVNLDCTARPGL